MKTYPNNPATGAPAANRCFPIPHRLEAGATFLEPLEPRIAPAVFVVNTLDDVDTSGDPDLMSLREAITASNDNGPGKDIIRFDKAVFGEGATIFLDIVGLGELPTIAGDLVIQGLGADRVTINAGGEGRIFTIDDGDMAVLRTVSINGLALTGGQHAKHGGAIYSVESLHLSDLVVNDNKAVITGGGIAMNSLGQFSLKNSTIAGNEALSYGGGLAVNASKIQVTNSLIADNKSGSLGGGGAFTLDGAKGVLTIQNTDFIGNSSDKMGGGLGIEVESIKSSVTIRDSQFVENSATWAGGGFLIGDFLFASEGAKIKLDNIVAANNSAGQAAGGSVQGQDVTSLTINNSQFHNNTAEGIAGKMFAQGNAGGLHLDGLGSAVLKNSVFSGNTAIAAFDGFDYTGGSGGALQATNTNLTAKGLTFAGNSATLEGGALSLAKDAAANISNSSFTGNSVFGPDYAKGGAIFANQSSLTISKTQIEGNNAGKGFGGGIWFDGDAGFLISKSEINGNSADVGGALAGAFDGDATISKSTFAGNVAGNGGAIGASMESPDAMFRIQSCVFHGNVADTAGGIGFELVADAQLSIEKSTISNNTSFNDGGGLFVIGEGQVLIQKSTIARNAAMGGGGGVFADLDSPGGLVLQRSSITGNLAGGDGGGLHNASATYSYAYFTDINRNFAAADSLMTFANIFGPVIGNTHQDAKMQQGTFVVNSLLDTGDPGTLRWAIEEANAAGKQATIVFYPALKGTISLAGDLPTLETGVAIRGSGADRIAIDGGGEFRIFHFDNGTDKVQKVSVSGISLVDGFAKAANLGGRGGAILNSGEALSLMDVMFWGNGSTDGGAAVFSEGSLSIQNSLFVNNSGGWGGGAIHSVSGMPQVVRDSLIFGNTSSYLGGGAHFMLTETGASLKMSNTALSGNTADWHGGGLYVRNESHKGGVHITDVILAANTAGDRGGGTLIETAATGTNAKIQIDRAIFNDNHAQRIGGGLHLMLFAENNKAMVNASGFFNNHSEEREGGGLILAHGKTGGATTVQNSTISGNTSNYQGAGAFVGGTLFSDTVSSNFAFKNVTISGNVSSGESGGGLYVEGLGYNIGFTLSNSALLGNSAQEYGGGAAAVSSVTMAVTNSLIAGNTAASGGGISATDGMLLQLTKSTISGNAATHDGGGVFVNDAHAAIAKTDFLANVAKFGGGLQIWDAYSGVVQSSLFRANVATTAGGGILSGMYSGYDASFTALAVIRNLAPSGGGMFLEGTADQTVTRSNFLSNHASADGGGIALDSGGLDLQRGIISGNTAANSGGGLFDNPGGVTPDKTKISGNWAPMDPNIG